VTLLLSASPEAWLQAVLADFDSFLLDHAACERKASAMAMHLAAHYRDRRVLVDAMVELACEELDHFRQVYRIVCERGLELAPDDKDPYVNAMNALARKGTHVPEEYLLDRLLLAGIVEARGCERFGMVAEALAEGRLKRFYQQIELSESRHRDLFLELAREYFTPAEIEQRQAGLLDAEAEIVARLPIRAALH
jgi:tRNA-(ms[2]io[6]A)-hydroxylase